MTPYEVQMMREALTWFAWGVSLWAYGLIVLYNLTRADRKRMVAGLTTAVVLFCFFQTAAVYADEVIVNDPCKACIGVSPSDWFYWFWSCWAC